MLSLLSALGKGRKCNLKIECPQIVGFGWYEARLSDSHAKEPLMPSKPTSKNKKSKTTKVEQIVNHLNRNSGASIPELVKMSRWQAHSIRGFISGALKKRGLVVVSRNRRVKTVVIC